MEKHELPYEKSEQDPTLSKLQLLSSALLVVYLKCATTHWILAARIVDKLVGYCFCIYNNACTRA